MGVHSQLVEIPATGGTPKPLTSGNHAIGGWTYFPAQGRHVFTKDDPDNGGDVWTMTAGAPTQVSHVFDRYAKDFRLPRQEKVEWKGADGVTVEGMLFYPLDYQAGPALSAGGADARRAAGVRQVRLRPLGQLHAGAGGQGLRGAASPTTAAAPATATRSCATWSATTS